VKWLKDLVLDGLALAGIGAIVAGLWMIYQPLAWIAGGIFLVAIAVVLAR
jgi:hypothetical protein